MSIVRLGLIGYGNMGRSHMRYLPQVAGVVVTALADDAPSALDRAATDHPDVRRFADGYALIDSGLVDAVLIATPHYFHPPLAIAAFVRGLHVLSEKPIAVTAKAAQEVLDAHAAHPELVYAIMFQQRTHPTSIKMKELIDAGTVGELLRVTYSVTDIFRSQSYYDSGGWRATWAGEGGGVLLNQCPHNLDLFQWLVGLPQRVTAHVGIGRFHRIEVEDDVTAYLEFANGATGVLIATTGEAPGENRLVITGDRGRIVSDGSNVLHVTRNEVGLRHHRDTTTQGFSAPPSTREVIDVPGDFPQHRGITENFVAAVREGAPLIAPASEGIRGLELGNAILMSGLTNQPVPVPTDRDAYARLIRDLASRSTFVKATTNTGAATDDDFVKSFR